MAVPGHACAKQRGQMRRDKEARGPCTCMMSSCCHRVIDAAKSAPDFACSSAPPPRSRSGMSALSACDGDDRLENTVRPLARGSCRRRTVALSCTHVVADTCLADHSKHATIVAILAHEHGMLACRKRRFQDWPHGDQQTTERTQFHCAGRHL